MSEYTQMADTFLANAHAKMDIRFIGRAVNVEWDERNSDLRNLYDVTITTPRGSMSIRFWDSIHNTQITQMSVSDKWLNCVALNSLFSRKSVLSP